MLLEKGADVNTRSGWALRTASKNSHKGVMPLLLENQADVNLVIVGNDGNPLLRHSVDDHEAVI